MTIDETISQFLLDGQYRISELAVEKEAIGNVFDDESIIIDSQIAEIYLLMDVLYVGVPSIKDGYNFLSWTNDEKKSVIEWVRNHTGMNTSPYIDFVANYPQIVNNIIDGGPVGTGAGFPSGNQNDFIYYQNSGNTPIAAPFPILIGQFDGDTVETYFINR